MDNTSTIAQRRWMGIALFMLVALSFSYFFRISPPAWYENASLPALIAPFKRLLGAFGVFLGAVGAERLWDTTRRITLVGTSPGRSGLMIVFPIVLFAGIGVPNDSGIESHLFGGVIGLQAALWVFLEEYGWRGYLQNELGFLPPLQRYLLVGTLWYAWHLWFLQLNPLADPANFMANLTVGLVIILAASWGIGVVAERTHSVLASACFHMLGSFLQFNPIITENVDQKVRWVLFTICLIFWVVILVRWPREDKVDEAVETIS